MCKKRGVLGAILALVCLPGIGSLGLYIPYTSLAWQVALCCPGWGQAEQAARCGVARRCPFHNTL